ncbi:hypothetical protein DL98DRAFT_582984 [Cadophora sp. DSE1049]|nr:hypothetical protein DL98DRAFT_582984 [Cadophora sp. DSE1049]
MRFRATTATIYFLCLSATALPGRHRGRPGAPAANINPPQNINQPNDNNNNPSNVSPTASINPPTSTNPPSNNNNNNPTNLDPSLVPVFSIKSGTGVGANSVAIPKTCPLRVQNSSPN